MATAARLGSRIDAGLLAGCVVLSLIAIALPNESREPIASALRRTIVAPLVGLQRGAERWRSAWVSSERLQLAQDSLLCAPSKSQALQLENDQLRKLIGLGTRLEWGFVPAEALHSTAPSEDLSPRSRSRRAARPGSSATARWSRRRVSSARSRTSIRR